MTAPMSGATEKRAISSHPAFRWVVALWFAALLGGGLFVMPDQVVANLRGALGVDRFVGNALMARLVLSALAGLFGLLLGLVIAMRIAAFGGVKDGDETEGMVEEDVESEGPWLEDDNEPVVDIAEEEAPRRPFNPREYLTDEGFETATEEQVEVIDADFEKLVEDPLGDSASGEEDEVIILPPGGTEEAEGPQVGVTDAEWKEVGSVTPAAIAEPLAAPEPRSDAAGDLSLADLTARLAQAIAARQAAEERGASPDEGDVDPVIAFLRREADRSAPLASTESMDEDPQASLRNALDRLSQVGNHT